MALVQTTYDKRVSESLGMAMRYVGNDICPTKNSKVLANNWLTRFGHFLSALSQLTLSSPVCHLLSLPQRCAYLLSVDTKAVIPFHYFKERKNTFWGFI